MKREINLREINLSYGDDYSIEVIRDLAVDTVIEIDLYLSGRKVTSNSFSKLAKILHATLEPKGALRGNRLIDYGGTSLPLANALQRHEKSIKETPYKIKHSGERLNIKFNLEELISVVHQISQDMASFKKLPEERQKALRNFSGELFYLPVLDSDIKRYLVA